MLNWRKTMLFCVKECFFGSNVKYSRSPLKFPSLHAAPSLPSPLQFHACRERLPLPPSLSSPLVAHPPLLLLPHQHGLPLHPDQPAVVVPEHGEEAGLGHLPHDDQITIISVRHRPAQVRVPVREEAPRGLLLLAVSDGRRDGGVDSHHRHQRIRRRETPVPGPSAEHRRAGVPAYCAGVEGGECTRAVDGVT